MAAARQTLRALGAVDADGRATPRGTRLARTGLHPRLARALVDGAPAVGARRAAEVVALLSEEPPRALGDDLGAVLRTVRDGRDPYAGRWREEVRRLQRGTDGGPAAAKEGGRTAAPLPDATAVGLVVALAFPERIARARVEKPEPGARSPYLMASGTAAELTPGTTLGAVPWLAVAVADRPAGAPSARVLHAAALDEDTARLAGAPLLTAREEVHWDTRRGEVTARRVESLGAVELASAKLDRPDRALVRAALLEGLAREGVSTLLSWPAGAAGLRERLAFLHGALGEPWPDVSDEALLAAAAQWLEPELSRARRRSDLARIDTAAALQRLLPWAGGTAGRLDELAPERITVPSGSRIRVDYSGERPVLAVKLQELFGWAAAPALAGGRVPLTVHLLSPPAARRPSPGTSPRSGGTATGPSAPTCAAATPATRGRRTRPPRSRRSAPTPGGETDGPGRGRPALGGRRARGGARGKHSASGSGPPAGYPERPGAYAGRFPDVASCPVKAPSDTTPPGGPA